MDEVFICLSGSFSCVEGGFL